MKFVSKNMNLRIVLSHGIPAEPMSGRNAVPGMYVKFEGGLADVKDEEMIKKMLNHSAFNSDFIAVEEDGRDPYADYRAEKEPQHQITEIVYGHVGKTTGTKPILTADQKKALRPMAEEMAKEMFKEMAPTLMKEMLKTMVAAKQEENSGMAEVISDVVVEDEESKVEESEAEEPKTEELKAEDIIIKKKPGRPARTQTTATV